MKIVFLNTWGGKVFQPLMEFLRESASTTDFFCLQEVFDSPPHQRVGSGGSPEARLLSWGGRSNIGVELKHALAGFQVSCYTPMADGCDGDEMMPISWGLTTFARKSITVDVCDAVPIAAPEVLHGNVPHPHFRMIQYIRFRRGERLFTLGNFHGTAYPGSKLDTPERISQSQKIFNFLAGEQGEKILGGDFNLMPDTESIRMIEEMGMRNLIKEFNIGTTRSELNYARYPEERRQYFSDYVFTSSGIKIASFQVPQLTISDHLPMILEIA